MLRKMIKGVKDAQASLLIKEVQTKTSFLGFFFPPFVLAVAKKVDNIWR